VVDELRRLLPRLEGPPAPSCLAFGIPAIDACLPGGGLASGVLHEVMPETVADVPAAFGFIAAVLSRIPPNGPVLLVVSSKGLAGYGRPHGHGLNTLGLDPARIILVDAGDDTQALWAIEEAARSGVPAAVAGTFKRGLDLKASRRLQLAAQSAGVPLLVLRPANAAGTSAAATRWRIGAAEAARDHFGFIARWRWRVRLERCRNGRAGQWLVEWDHVTHRFSLAAAMADRALPCRADLQPLARAG
jgi:protein ImuA